MKKLYKDYGEQLINEILENKTKSLPGGLPHLLYGSRISTASLFIKIGRNFEKWFRFIAEDCGMEMLPDGVMKNVINGKSKDIDLLFINKETKTIHYRELKSNIELDTEKLPATYNKIVKINEYVKKEYPNYEVDSRLLNWSVYNKDVLPKKYNTKITKCNEAGVRVSWPVDFFNIVGADISEQDYYDFFRDLGKMTNETNN